MFLNYRENFQYACFHTIYRIVSILNRFFLQSFLQYFHCYTASTKVRVFSIVPWSKFRCSVIVSASFGTPTRVNTLLLNKVSSSTSKVKLLNHCPPVNLSRIQFGSIFVYKLSTIRYTDSSAQ